MKAVVTKKVANAFVLIAVLAAAFAWTVAAQAKPAPLDLWQTSLTTDDVAIDSGPSGASLESEYFGSPRRPFAVGRVFPCRLQLRVSAKTWLARTCR